MSGKKRIADYEKLVAENPTDVRLLQKLGEACQMAGDDKKAAEALARVAGIYERDGFLLKAVALLKQVLKLDSSRYDLQFKLADLHFQLQLQGESVGYLRLALKAARERADAETCLAVARKFVEVDPESAEFRLHLADWLLDRGSLVEAGAELLKAALLLRTAHPDLAASAEGMQWGAGPMDAGSARRQLNALLIELHRRDALNVGLLRLDFERPN